MSVTTGSRAKTRRQRPALRISSKQVSVVLFLLWMRVTTGSRAKTRRQRPALRKSLTSTTASTIAQQKRFLSMSSRVDSVIGLSQELGAIIFGELCSPVFHLQPV